MKLQAEIGADKHRVELKRDENRVFASIDEREYEVEVSEPEANVYLIKNGGKICEVFVSPHTQAGEAMQVRVGSDEIEVRISDPKRLRGSSVNGEQADGLAEIRTAMPGKVVRILVSAGDVVKKGDGVIVVEAMKMQNEMKSPKDGTVSECRVAENDNVGAGEVLVVIE